MRLNLSGKQMTKSEIMKQAHTVAKRDLRLYDSYREAFADAMRAVHKSLHTPPSTTGFFIKEPWYKANRYARQHGWVEL